MNNIEIKAYNLLKKSITRFYANDSLLVSIRGTERSCVFKIGAYLNELVNCELGSDYNVDSEYNKKLKNPKVDHKFKLVRPDLIIHKRNTSDENANILAIEFKGWWNNSEKDIEKLKDFTNPKYEYKYKLAILIKLNKKQENVVYKFFQKGKEINENIILDKSRNKT